MQLDRLKRRELIALLGGRPGGNFTGVTLAAAELPGTAARDGSGGRHLRRDGQSEQCQGCRDRHQISPRRGRDPRAAIHILEALR